VEDPIQRARLRFESMLTSAQQAAEWATDGRPRVLSSSDLMLVAAKAMNRAGGFLEAIGILAPELGRELLDEFESFALRVDSISSATRAEGERRIAGGRHSRDDQRAADRRLGHDRRGHWKEVSVDRRRTPDRRAESDRRTGKIRELADRRWRAIQS
jgi:hypothetical protein